MSSKEAIEKTLTTLPAGALVVWQPGQHGANATYGHVAVVEKVEANGIWVSDSGWYGKGGSPRFIPADKLQDLHIIPPGATPLSKDRYVERIGLRKT